MRHQGLHLLSEYIPLAGELARWAARTPPINEELEAAFRRAVPLNIAARRFDNAVNAALENAKKEVGCELSRGIRQWRDRLFSKVVI